MAAPVSSLRQANAAPGHAAISQLESKPARASLATLPESPDGAPHNPLTSAADAAASPPEMQASGLDATAAIAGEISQLSRKQHPGTLAHALSVPLPGKPPGNTHRLHHQLPTTAEATEGNAHEQPHEALRSLRVRARVDQMSPMMNFGQPVANPRAKPTCLERMHSQPQTVADMQGRAPQQPTATPSVLVASLALPPEDTLGGVTCGVQSDSSDDDEPPQDGPEHHPEHEHVSDGGNLPAARNMQQQPIGDLVKDFQKLPSACKQQQAPRAMDVFEDDPEIATGKQSRAAAMGAWMHQASSTVKKQARKRMHASPTRQALASGRRKEQPIPDTLGVATTAAGSALTTTAGEPIAAPTMASLGQGAIAGACAGFTEPDQPSAPSGPASLPEAESMQAATAVTSPPALEMPLDHESDAAVDGPGKSPSQMSLGRSIPVAEEARLMEAMPTPANPPRPSAQPRAKQGLHGQKAAPNAANAASHGALPAERSSSQQVTPAGQQKGPRPMQIAAGGQSQAMPSPFAACQAAQVGHAHGSEGQALGIAPSSGQVSLGGHLDSPSDDLKASEGIAQQDDASPEAPDPTSPFETHSHRGAASRPLAARQAAATTDPGLQLPTLRPAAKETVVKPRAPGNKENQPVTGLRQGSSHEEGLQTDQDQPGVAGHRQDHDRSTPEVM